MKKNRLYSQTELISMGYNARKLESMVNNGDLEVFMINGKKYYRLMDKSQRKPRGSEDK